MKKTFASVATFDGVDLRFYVYDHNLVNIEEFLELQYVALIVAAEEKFKLFKQYKPERLEEELGEILTLGLN